MTNSLSKELARSVLAAAGSFQGLEDELDRLSLHSAMSESVSTPRISGSSHRHSKRSKSITDSPLSTRGSGNVTRRLSRSSSKYDSAIGSLPSQADTTTEEENTPRSSRSHRKHSKKVDRSLSYQQSDWDWLLHTQDKSVKKRSKVRRRETCRQPDISRQQSTSSSTSATPTPKNKHRHQLPTAKLPIIEMLKRGGSLQSLSSTDSYSSSSNSSKRSSRVLSIGLSEQDIFAMSTLHTKPNLTRTNSTVSDLFSPKEQYAEIVYIPPPPEQSNNAAEDLESNSSSSTVIGDNENSPQQTTEEKLITPVVPEITIVTETAREEDKTVTVQFSDSTLSQTLTPNKRLNSSNPPTRSASFLQRIKLRRGTSFKVEGRQKKRVPVRRSFSDRIMYQIKKGQIEYKRDMNFISNPSHPRPIGRMIDKLAGRLHLVQLHRPPNGRYGIYITQSQTRKGIFVSRFADSNTAKFCSGLISPGDEIVKINKQRVKEKSVDFVYDTIAKLDSVVFTILPVNSRPDW